MMKRKLSDVSIVAAEDGCPTCGERDADELAWDDDGDLVTCGQCGTTYTPPAIAASEHRRNGKSIQS